MSKTIVRIIALVLVLLLGIVVIPSGFALALCNRTGGSGSDDIYVCSDPPDTDGVATYGGHDTLTVQSGTTVSSSGLYVIDMGTGNDVLNNHGSILGSTSAVHMRDGNATVNNYHLITAASDGVWCVVYAGQTCELNNFGTIEVNEETLDVRSYGGLTIVNNSGTLLSEHQETLHLHGSPEYSNANRVTNSGTIRAWKSGMETAYGSLYLENSGTVHSRNEMAVNTGGDQDTIINRGLIQADNWYAIGSSGGADHLTNEGTILSNSPNGGDSTVDMGTHDDVLITSGDILMNGAGSRSVNLGDGNDRMTIRGGRINKTIDGNLKYDILTFELSGTQSELDAFRAQAMAGTPASGQAAWRGNTYRWVNFEEIRYNFTVTDGSAPTATPSPTATLQPPTPTEPPTSTPPSSGALAAGYYEQDYPAIAYASAWSDLNTGSASGGSYTYSWRSDAVVSFSFTGSRLTVIRRTDSSRGDMDVCIDGTCHTVSSYSASTLWQQPVSFDVASGVRSVQIRSKGNGTIDLDAIQIEDGGSAPTATPTDVPTTQPTLTATPTFTPTDVPTVGPTSTPTDTPSGPACPPSVPAGVTARRHTPLTGSRDLTLEWEDVGADPCMGVTQYTVYSWYGSFAQQWVFDRAAIACNGNICTASITLPSTISTAYWRVTARNALGEGPSDNSKRWSFQ